MLTALQAGDTALTRSERLLSYWQQYKPLTRTIKVHVQEAFQLPIAPTGCLKILACNTTKPKVQSQIIGVYPEEQASCVPTQLCAVTCLTCSIVEHVQKLCTHTRSILIVRCGAAASVHKRVMCTDCRARTQVYSGKLSVHAAGAAYLH